MLADTAPLRKILKSPIPAFIIKEIREAVPATAFFAIGFNLIVPTTQLILEDRHALVRCQMKTVGSYALVVMGDEAITAMPPIHFEWFEGGNC